MLSLVFKNPVFVTVENDNDPIMPTKSVRGPNVLMVQSTLGN